MIPDGFVTTPQLEQLLEASVLEPGEVHVADAIARSTGDHGPDLLLAAALAVRAPRLGHVCLDIDRLHEVGLVTDPAGLPAASLPERGGWLSSLASSPAVREADDASSPPAPLVLDGARLYLDRYWRYEQRLASGLLGLLGREVSGLHHADLDETLDRLFPDDRDRFQRQAASVAVSSALTVLTGGPGTGKTTTVVRVLAALWLTADGSQRPRFVLAAPTGKAAARMSQALREALDHLAVPDDVVTALRHVPALTVHRLLGFQPGSPTRFRHHRDHPLPYDVVVLDEASMASLPLMAKLVDGLSPTARLVMVGDRDQLTSVDAGAVLSDICGADETAQPSEPSIDPRPSIAEVIVRLRRNHRFGPESGIGALARAIQGMATDRDPAAADEVIALLTGQRTEPGGPDRYADIALIAPGRSPASAIPADVLADIVAGYETAVRAAQEGASPLEVLAFFDRLRVLAASRHGPGGVLHLDRLIADAIARTVDGFDPSARFAVGRPVMITRNDHQLGLYNGDIGVVVPGRQGAGSHRVAFPDDDEGVRFLASSRLSAVESVFALSVHKSQGSQFDQVVVLLPHEDVPLLTRELIYTAVTRASERVTLVGDEQVLRDALARRVQRASGLTEQLWGGRS